MIIRNTLLAGALSAALAAAVGMPALAQAAVTVGAKVKDTAGGEVGTITAVNGSTVTLKTDKHEVQLPVASFTAHQGGLLMAMTRDQLNAEVDKSLAAAQANLTPGVTVRGAGGVTVGTLDAIDAQFATLKLTSGKLVRIPRSGIAADANGAVVGITAAELSAAADAAASGTPTS